MRQVALRVGLLVAGILALGGAFGAAPAQAHAVLEQTSPVDGAVLPHQPAQVTLRFDEAVTLTSNSVQLFDASGHGVDVPRATHLGGTTIAANLPAGLDDGTYVVSWRVVSADSHVVSGAFQFSVGAPSPAVVTHGSASNALPDDVRKGVDALAFLGFVLVVGGVVFLAFVWPGPGGPRRVGLVVAGGFALLALGTVLSFLMQYPYATAGSLGSAFSGTALHSTVSTGLGRALLVRLGIVAVLGVAVLGGAGLARDRPAARVVAALALVALPFTWTLTDHSHVGAQQWLAIPVGSLHLLAVGVWLGGLIPLAVCVLARVPGTELALPRFSRIALPAFTVIILTGLYQTWRQVGTLPALPHTAFGRLLLIKLGGIVAILGLASQARRFVQRRQPLTERAGWPWLRRSLAVEGTLGVAVLAVATVMVNTSPARTSYTPPVHANLALPRDGGHVEVRLAPAKQGLNVADIYVVAADGALRAVPEVTAQLAPGRRGGAPAAAVKVDPAEPGHYVADTVSIPYAGVWQLQLYVRTGEFDEASLLVRFRAH